MITDIHLQHFRSYANASFELDPGVNIIVGPNTSGKTNLLESLLVIAKGSSYRTNDSGLIEYGENIARLEAHTPTGSRVVKISQTDSLIQKVFEINSQHLKRLDMSKAIPVVLFEPDHLLELIGSSEARRNFIDDWLSQTVSGFSALRSQYRRALSQRNSLLKKQQTEIETQLFAWNVRLSSLAGQIVRERLQLIESINQDFTTIYQKLSKSKSKSDIVYHSPIKVDQYETSLLSSLEASTDIDIRRGFTSRGPHRDDIIVMLNKIPAQDSASRGENRTLLLALKIIEAQKTKETRGVAPILLLDDVFSELDGGRRFALTKFLVDYQTFITTTDADVVVQHFTQTSNIIPLINRSKNKN